MENKDLESLCHLNARSYTHASTHTHTNRHAPYLCAAFVQMEMLKAIPAQTHLFLTAGVCERVLPAVLNPLLNIFIPSLCKLRHQLALMAVKNVSSVFAGVNNSYRSGKAATFALN